MLQQRADDLEVIEVRLRHRVVAAFDVAVVGGQVKRCPPALVGEVHVRAAVDQHLGERVVAVVDRRQQRRPPVLGRLVDLRAASDEGLRRVDVAFARGEHERSESAAALADQTCLHGHVVTVDGGIRHRAAGILAAAGRRRAPLDDDLFVVGASGRGRALAARPCRFHCAHVHTGRHVVPRQSRGT